MDAKQQIRWQDIDPKDAVDLDLSKRLDITAPLNENGERCPWPWEPQQLVGVPMGQYHCSYCLAMCVAGVEHPDYQPGWDDEYRAMTEAEVAEAANLLQEARRLGRCDGRVVAYADGRTARCSLLPGHDGECA